MIPIDNATLKLMMQDQTNQDLIQLAAQKLLSGEVIGLPTETVYGLAADAQNHAAVAQIFSLKNRPTTHPLITHIAVDADIDYWLDTTKINAEMRDLINVLTDVFWPGPLTLVLPKSPQIDACVTGGQDTIALRCPNHSMAQAVLQAFAKIKKTPNVGIAAPSANRFGRVSPTRAAHVREEFNDNVWVLDGDASVIGIESTIIDLTRGAPVLLRHGHVTPDDIFNATGLLPIENRANAPRVSGTMLAHYAPATPLVWLSECTLTAGDALMSHSIRAASSHPHQIVLEPTPQGYARGLYHAMRELDALKCSRIVVEDLPIDASWDAVRDRLKRAVVGSNLSA